MNKVFIYDKEMNIQRCYGTEYQGMIVQYIDHMGDDNSVVNSARVSFAKEASNFTDEQNHRLIRYLAKHKHEIPFAHTAITLRMKAPIAIRTQCFKHKVGFVENEVSRRYVSDTPELFIPDFWRTKPIGNVKQGSGTSKVDINTEFKKGFCINCGYTTCGSSYEQICNEMIDLYKAMIKADISPEQARFVLPQGVMTEWVWTGSLLAFARFYNLRTDTHAQKEIQDLAQMVGEIIEPLYPVSWNALTGN